MQIPFGESSKSWNLRLKYYAQTHRFRFNIESCQIWFIISFHILQISCISAYTLSPSLLCVFGLYIMQNIVVMMYIYKCNCTKANVIKYSNDTRIFSTALIVCKHEWSICEFLRSRTAKWASAEANWRLSSIYISISMCILYFFTREERESSGKAMILLQKWWPKIVKEFSALSCVTLIVFKVSTTTTTIKIWFNFKLRKSRTVEPPTNVCVTGLK